MAFGTLMTRWPYIHNGLGKKQTYLIKLLIKILIQLVPVMFYGEKKNCLFKYISYISLIKIKTVFQINVYMHSI